MSAAIITEQMLKEMTANNPMNGLIMCRDYSIELTKTGKEYIKGTLYSGISVPFKCWGDSTAFTELKNNNYKGLPVYIVSTVDEYKGSFSLTVSTMQAINEEDIDKSIFMPTKYDKEGYWNALYNLFVSNVSPACKAILDTIMTPELKEDFCMEFAAVSHHDNCKSGLLAHTYKVMVNLNYLLAAYPTLATDQSFKDVLFLGTFLHDIGKTNEMELGVWQENGFVTHRYFGIEYIFPLKQDIINALGEKNYYNLVSIITQHHGKFAEPCGSLAAYIVHYVDCMDSTFTTILEAMADNKDKVRIDEQNLNF